MVAPLAVDTAADFHAILNVLPGCFIILKCDAPRFTIAWVNDNYLHVTHKEREDIAGYGLFDVFPDNEETARARGVLNIRASLQFVVDNKTEHLMPLQRYDVLNPATKQYEEHYWKLASYPVLDGQQKVQYIVHAVENVTEKVKLQQREKLAWEQVEYERMVYYNLFSQAPVAIAVLKGPDLTIEFANDSMLELWGKTKDILNKPLLEGLPEIEGQVYHTLLQNVLQTGETYADREGLVRLQRNGKMEDGYFDFTYSALRGLNGLRDRVIAIATEITEQVKARKLMEENASQLELKIQERTIELTEANHTLELSNKKMEEFAYAASHDLQEPLRKILTFMDMLDVNEKEQLHDADKTIFKKIRNAAERMKLLINNLFIFSTTSSSLDEAFQPVDLNEILDYVKEDLAVQVTQANAQIKSTHLPTINAIPTQIHQLFQNLIGNSLKYFKPSVPCIINITHKIINTGNNAEKGLLPNTRYLKIDFIDNGIGFLPVYSEKIFQLFQRLHGKAEYPGTGIGLAICRNIAENHKGYITANGRPDEGATFTVYLKYTAKD